MTLKKLRQSQTGCLYGKRNEQIHNLWRTKLLEIGLIWALLHGSDNSRKPPLPVIQAMRFV